MHLMNSLLDFAFSALDQGGYWIIFLIATAEALPFVGTIVPGHTLVIGAGFLSQLGLLSLPLVMIVASAGAIFGDLISYYIGGRWGHAILSRYGKYIFFKSAQIERTKRLLVEHPAKALILGRFVSVTRALAPFLAGVSKVPWFRFLWLNIAGGISWAVSSVLIGFIFGESYEIASKYVGRVIFFAIIAAIAIGYGYSFLNKTKHIFKKYHGYVVSLNLASLYVFAKLVEDVLDHESVVRLDELVNQKMSLLQTPALTQLMIGITNLGGVVVLAILSAGLLIILLRQRRWHHALLLFFGLAGGGTIEFTTKWLMHRPRPLLPIIPETGYSFPSAHATMATIFFAVLLVAWHRDIKNRTLRYGYYIANISLFTLIGFSRVYLGVHWMSDVMAGFALALFWLTLLVLIFRLFDSMFYRTLVKLWPSHRLASSSSTASVATFGAGCFWGVEETFRQLHGVKDTAVGYMGGKLEHPSYEDVCRGNSNHVEVVQVAYDPAEISYDKLLQVFWDNHNPTTLNRQGPDVGTQYRSVIFFHTPEQKTLAEKSKLALAQSGRFNSPIVTEIVPAEKFYRAEEYHQRYLAKQGKSACRV